VERCPLPDGSVHHDIKPAECSLCGGTGWRPKPQALAWVRDIRDQCVAAGVPFFFKQWGGPTSKSGGRLLDGRTWEEMPVLAPSPVPAGTPGGDEGAPIAHRPHTPAIDSGRTM